MVRCRVTSNAASVYSTGSVVPHRQVMGAIVLFHVISVLFQCHIITFSIPSCYIDSSHGMSHCLLTGWTLISNIVLIVGVLSDVNLHFIVQMFPLARMQFRTIQVI